MVHEYGNGIAWSRRSVLGQGYFGRVFLAAVNNHSSIDNNLPPLVAVKSVKDVIHTEREVYRKIKDCPYILRCFGEETTTGENGEVVYNLLLEYCSGGTLKQKIINEGYEGGLPEIEVRFYTRSILRGIYHVHCMRYVHRDIKPDNILLVPNKGGTFNVKICDFGLSKRSEDVRYWEGSPKFLSPEAVISGVQGAPADIWAIGCLVLELLTGKPAWDDCLSDDEVLKKVGSGGECPHISDEISEEARDFLNCCFQREPMHRSTAEILLQHPFVRDLSDDYEIVENNDECDDANYDDDMADYSHEYDDYDVQENGYKNTIGEQENDHIAEQEEVYFDAIGEEHELLKHNRFFTWFYHYLRIIICSSYYMVTMFSRFWRRESP